jgi:hypothetical protein
MTITTSEANPNPEVDINLERATRERLGVSLARLAALKPTDLVHPPHSKASFRGGLPYFQRTLGLFHQLADGDLRHVPSEYLKIVADDAEQALNQLQEILNFSGENLQNPDQVRGELIGEVRDSYRPMYEDIALIVKTPPEQVEHVPSRRTGAMLIMGLAALVLAAGVLAFQYEIYTAVVSQVTGAISGR